MTHIREEGIQPIQREMRWVGEVSPESRDKPNAGEEAMEEPADGEEVECQGMG